MTTATVVKKKAGKGKAVVVKHEIWGNDIALMLRLDKTVVDSIPDKVKLVYLIGKYAYAFKVSNSTSKTKLGQSIAKNFPSFDSNSYLSFAIKLATKTDKEMESTLDWFKAEKPNMGNPKRLWYAWADKHDLNKSTGDTLTVEEKAEKDKTPEQKKADREAKKKAEDKKAEKAKSTAIESLPLVDKLALFGEACNVLISTNNSSPLTVQQKKSVKFALVNLTKALQLDRV